MSTTENESLTVGTATAAPGQMVRGAIPALAMAGGVKVDIPVVVINGAGPGPTFWVNAAIHGDEPEGPLACALAAQRIDPSACAVRSSWCPASTRWPFRRPSGATRSIPSPMT